MSIESELRELDRQLEEPINWNSRSGKATRIAVRTGLYAGVMTVLTAVTFVLIPAVAPDPAPDMPEIHLSTE